MGKELWHWILETLRTDLVPIFTFELWILGKVSWGCCWSVVNSCLNFCSCSMPGFPVLHHFWESVQTQVHWRWWCHPTISSSVVPFSFLQSFLHQGLFQWVGLSHQVASILEFQLQHHSFQWIFRQISFDLIGLVSLLSKGLSRAFSNTIVQKHHFFRAHLSLWSNSHIHTWLLEKPYLWLDGPLSEKCYLCFLICCLGWS